MKQLFAKKEDTREVWDHLEAWANKDTNVLDEFGAETFTTEQLVQLKRSFVSQAARLRSQQKLLTWFALSSMGWAFFGAFAYLMGMFRVAKIILYCSPITIFVWLGLLMFTLYKNHRIPEYSDRIYLIDMELKRRHDHQVF